VVFYTTEWGLPRHHTMTYQHRADRAELRGFLAVMGLLIGLLLGGGVATAATRAELWQATVPLADRSDAAYGRAFQDALKIVLVRVTGRRSAAAEPALSPLVSQARRYVQQFHATADGQVSVAFDGTALERWLAQNDQPFWGGERPLTFVWLGEETGPQTGTVVTRDGSSELKAALEAQAAARGIQLLWPTAADLQANHIDFAALGATPASSLAELARHLGGDGVLVGRASNATANANLRWTYVYQDHSNEFSGTLEGVDRAADAYASALATSGNSVPIAIEVAGINDVKDYAGVQTYLESLSFISHVGVEALHGDTVRFALLARGGAATLQRALSLHGPLVPLATDDTGLLRFQLRR
jgi:hypothetical protein